VSSNREREREVKRVVQRVEERGGLQGHAFSPATAARTERCVREMLEREQAAAGGSAGAARSSSSSSVGSRSSSSVGRRPASASAAADVLLQRLSTAALLERLSSGASGFDTNGELCVLHHRLYLAALKGTPTRQPQKQYISCSKKMMYVPFAADFGPFNLGTVHYICKAIGKKLQDPELEETRVVYYTSQHPKDITNAIFLLGAFVCLRLGATPAEAWRVFSKLPPSVCLPYRDATWVKSEYDLHVRDCWAGLVRALQTGLYDLKTFDVKEYLYYDNPANGDLHVVVPGKFVAIRGPRSREQQHSFRPEAYLEVFKDLRVASIVRLNKPEYKRAVFEKSGFKHYDLVIRDATPDAVPPDHIADRFLRRGEGQVAGQLIAVHCASGLGHTGDASSTSSLRPQALVALGLIH
jgi:cell division cycle 14